MQALVVAIGYISVLWIYWTPESSRKFRYASYGVWLVISLYLSNALGVYPVLVFCGLQLLCLVGFIWEVLLIMEHDELAGNRTSFADAVRRALTNDDCAVEVKSIDGTSVDEEDDKFVDDLPMRKDGSPEVAARPTALSRTGELPGLRRKLAGKSASLDTGSGGTKYVGKNGARTPTHQVSISERYFLRKLKAELRMSLDVPEDTGNTDNYMYGVLYACAGMFLWKNKWILQILTIPVVYYVIKKIGSCFGFWETIGGRISAGMDTVRNWCVERHRALVPAAVRGLGKVYIIFDRKMTDALRGSVDAVATIAVILGLLVFTFCASVFITIQVRRKSRNKNSANFDY